MGRRKKPAAHHGLLLVDKAQGWTSHDVVAKVRGIVGQRQVGHTGTLDPMATGLLALPLGRATRLARFVEAEHKTYEAEISLGRATNTWDAEGETTETSDVNVTADAIAETLATLYGALEIEVPAFSAIKVDGQRLYKRARAGEDVQAPLRTMTVLQSELHSVDGQMLRARFAVSKGTYIRSLAVELGKRLGVPAHLSGLRRTSVGRFSVEQAITLGDDVDWQAGLISVADTVAHLKTVQVSAEAAADVLQGRRLRVEQTGVVLEKGSLVRVLDPAGELLAVAEWMDTTGRPNATALAYACVVALRPNA